jgi:hypothetical protein
MQIGICLVPDEFRTAPKIPRFGDFKGQSLEFPSHKFQFIESPINKRRKYVKRKKK